MEDFESITKRYEMLRSCAIEGEASFGAHSLGYTLLLRQGMAGWLKGWKNCMGTLPPKETPLDGMESAAVVTPEVSTVTHILTSIILGHLGKAASR